MEKKYSIISLMGDKILTRDSNGLMREFETSEIITSAMSGTEFTSDSSINQEVFCKVMNELFLSQ